MPLCSNCRSEADVTIVGRERSALEKWIDEKIFPTTDHEEPDRCSRCDSCGNYF